MLCTLLLLHENIILYVERLPSVIVDSLPQQKGSTETKHASYLEMCPLSREFASTFTKKIRV